MSSANAKDQFVRFWKKLGLTFLILSPVLGYIAGSYIYEATLPLDKPPFVHWCGLDPHSEVYVTWETSQETSSYIRYSTDLSNWTERENATLTTFHKFHLTGLAPDTRYFYQAGASSSVPAGELHAVRSFKTAPSVLKEFNITLISDTQQLLGMGFYNTIGQAIKNAGDTDFLVNAGDLADDSKDQGLWNQFFLESPYTDRIPLVPSPGNHDGIDDAGSLYVKYFGITENGRDVFYTFNWSNTQFVVGQIGSRSHVDPSDPRNAAHFAWLNQTLEKGQGMDYRVVIYHINRMEIMAPIIEKYNASLVVYGHVHQYRREYYNNHTYVCLGNGATIQATMIEDEPYVQKRTNGAGFSRLFFNATGIKLETYTPTMDILDSVFLRRSGPGGVMLVPDKIVT
nr:metallophosphoesterase family protein [Candidatus Sigynarchaeum springense]